MNTFFIDTIEAALPMSALIAVLLMLSPLIKKGCAAKWRYFMWLFVAVRLILPFKIKIFSAPVTVEIPAAPTGAATATAMTATAAQVPHISLQTIAMLIWLAGIAVFAAYQLINYFSFKRNVRRWSSPVTDERLNDALDEAMTAIGETRRLGFKICKIVSTPMIFGFIRPTLLLPADDYTDEELDVILRHELIHFKRSDVWYKLILMTANALNWFNPLVYLMVRAANRDIELACDAEVVKGKDMDFRQTYCRAILTVVHNKGRASTPLSTCFIISKKVIKERFTDILSFKKKRGGYLMFAAVAVSVLVCGSLISFASEQTAQVLEDEFNIIERPTAAPKAEPTPYVTAQPSDAPEAAPVYISEEEYAYVPEEVPTEEEYTVPEITEEYAEEYAYVPEYTESGKTAVNLNGQSNNMYINFSELGEEYNSASAFTTDKDTDMVVISDGGCTVRIIDDKTGSVVAEQEMTEDGGSLTVPMSAGSEYSINAVATEDEYPFDPFDPYTSIYVYGK